MVPYNIYTGDRMRPYQLRASNKIYMGNEQAGTAVIVDMGLGKTISVLHAIQELIVWGRINRPVLVVAPINVCTTVWRQEAAVWSSTLDLKFSLLRGNTSERQIALYRPAHIYLINPELLEWLHKELRGDWDYFDMLVVDESSMFKSHSSKRFKLLSNYGDRHTIKGPDGRSLRNHQGKLIRVGMHRFKRVVIMTGTPAPTSLINLWPQIYLLDEGKRLHANFETFRDHYFYKEGQVADHVYRWGMPDEELEVRPDWMPKDGAPVKIHELIADITIDLNAEDYGILPAVIGDASKGPVPPTHMHYIELPPAVRELYDTMEKHAIIELNNDFIMAVNGGAKSMLCHQIANGFIYKTDDFGLNTTEYLHELKLNKLLELIDILNTNIIVTYHFQADKSRIISALTRAGIQHGVMTSKNAEKILPLWNRGALPVMLLHPQSAGHGINAQNGGHTMIWYSQVWSHERYSQTLARLARSGQKYIVGNHHIAAAKTVDELMLMTYLERGDTQSRFRSALRKYQQLRGWGI